MDRNEAFAEYGRILKDAADWLTRGYRGSGEENESPVRPPANPGGTGTAAPEALAKSERGGPRSDSSFSGTGTAAAPLTGGSPAAKSFPGNGGSARLPDGPSASDPSQAPSVVPGPAQSGQLGDIAAAVAECRDCNLYLIRENTVPGVGSTGATLMIVTPPPADGAGEGDGPLPAFEAEYLAKWLAALELDPARDVFITPAVKCRTPGGRPPHAEESAACAGHLRAQYKAVRPKAVLALGDAACGALTGSAADFPSLVAQDWTWGAVPALVLWTPAEVLANPTRLRKPVWESLQRLKAAWNAAGTGV